MNKLTKAAIAGAAGVILLMGGAGSLAYWNDSIASNPAGQTISAGTLTVTAASAGGWTKAFSGTSTYPAGTAVRRHHRRARGSGQPSGLHPDLQRERNG